MLPAQPSHIVALSGLLVWLSQDVLALHVSHNEVFRQELENDGDIGYNANMEIGGQKIKAILDTGSFEILVFDAKCGKGCGQAGKYNPEKSTSFSAGPRHKVHAYGSGDCKSIDGFDTVRVGPLTSQGQAEWIATDCNMPVLKVATFNAIVGVGPPGQPKLTAQSTLDQIAELESSGQPLNSQVTQIKAEAQADLEDAPKKPALLEKFGTTAFSICLGRKNGSPGYFIWNSGAGQVTPLTLKATVTGKIHWGLQVKNMKVGMATVGCIRGCGAIVDSGTSLIALPTTVFKQVTMALMFHAKDMLFCNWKSLPDLVLTFGGHTLRLPPVSYIGRAFGNPVADVAKFLPQELTDKTRNPYFNTTSRQAANKSLVCTPLLMDLGNEETQEGPMMILGMPFFRQYFTTFDLASTPTGGRSISVTPASATGCLPATDAGRSADDEDMEPLWVDMSKLRIPHYLRNRKAKII